MRHAMMFGTAVLIGVVLFGGASEIILRFMPVQTPLRSLATSTENPIFRLQPNQVFTYSNDSLFSVVADGKVNGAGFVNDQEYDAQSAVPLMAVIGDSYVEALMVAHQQTLQGRLSKRVGARGRIYSFARSGAALSEYIAYANWARMTYQPDALVFVIVGNDFDQSLATYGISPGLHVYEETANGELVLMRRDYAPNWKGKTLLFAADHSKLAAYLLYNLKIELAYHRLKTAGITEGFGTIAAAWRGAAPEVPTSNNLDAARVNAARVNAGRRAIEAFFRDLPTAAGLPASKILFVIDADRDAASLAQPIGAVGSGSFDIMRKAFLSAALGHGYSVIDMQPIFRYRYQQDGTAFLFPTDGHWNAAAHALAADQVADSQLFQMLFPAN